MFTARMCYLNTDRSRGTRVKVEPRLSGENCLQCYKLTSRGRWRGSCWNRRVPTFQRPLLGWEKAAFVVILDSVHLSVGVFVLDATQIWARFLLQAASTNKELSLHLSKLQYEDAALRDSLTKMGNLNEGLVQDKVDLNKYILQVMAAKHLKSWEFTLSASNYVHLQSFSFF